MTSENPPAPPALVAAGIRRAFGPRVAVEGLDCRVEPGTILGLLGPNGAGKSTTLNLLAGVLAPEQGRIFINGVDLARQPRAAKRQLGYLADPPPLYPELQVTEYLHFCARLQGFSGRDARKAVGRVVARCALTQVAHQPTATLSKGFRQRVGIAQAILHQPAVLLLDEPSAGLDPWQMQEFRGLIQELAEHSAVVLSTHLLGEVQALCSHALLLARGRTVFSGTVADLRASLQSSSLRLGLASPPGEAALRALPGVEQVEAIDAGRFRLRHDNAARPAQAIAEIAVNEGWGLLELTPEQPGLEQALMEWTPEEAA